MTNKQERPPFRPLPELEHLADPNYSTLRKEHKLPTDAQLLARRRGSLLMIIGGVTAQMQNIRREVANLQLAPIDLTNSATLEAITHLMKRLDEDLRKQWGYKKLGERNEQDS